MAEIEQASARGVGRTSVRLRTLVVIRWIAVAGQLVSILVVHFTLGFALPLGSTLAAVGASVALNVVVSLAWPASTRLSGRDAALYLGYDVIQLAVLVALTGGLANPFSLLFLVPVTISATILSLRATAALCALVLVSISIVAKYHWPLPWADAAFALPPLYLLALWLAMALGTIIIAAYTWRIAADARRMADALAATRTALAQEHRMAALGALAAAAAHELGTPLATIAVIVRGMERSLPEESALTEDVALLTSQTARCREILGRLSRLDEETGEHPFGRLPLSALAEAAADPHRRTGLTVEIETADEEAEPMVTRRAEILHGLGNLIENAAQFAREQVTVTVAWDPASASVTVLDDGPGFPPGLLPALGEPYISSRREQGRMGLGVFIAKTLLEQTGADVAFSNAQTGARVRISWPRAALEHREEDG
jgi:two-component system sensor histidine kinase RegB